MRALDNLFGLPRSSEEQREFLNRFQLGLLLVLTYSMDRGTNGEYERMREKYRKIFGSPVEIDELLDRSFLTSLYVDRAEKDEIEGLLFGHRPILIHGLVGVGKTIVLRKIEDEVKDLMNFSYIDLRREAEWLVDLPTSEFDTTFRDFVFEKIFSDFILPSIDLREKWKVYKVMHDRGYSSFRQKASDIYAKPLNSLNDWSKALRNERLRRLFIDTNVGVDLKTLLRFVKDQKMCVICFDNVDRYSLKVQRRILSNSIDINYGADIPVIFTIRESNLKRVIKEAKEEQNDESPLGDTILVGYMEKLEVREEPSIAVGKLNKSTIYELMKKRIDFVEEHEAFGTLKDYMEQFLSELGREISQFQNDFWMVYRMVCDAFIKEGIYELCNHNIRELLKLYFRFVTRLMFNPEDEYSLNRIMSTDYSTRKTRLHTFFYKWVVCNGGVLPQSEGSIPNIFDGGNHQLKLLDHRLLAYIISWYQTFPDRRLRFDQLAKDFKRFGIKRSTVKNHISKLSVGYGMPELGLISLDKKKKNRITDGATIDYLPAGKYFVETLSSTREYAFWSVLDADLSDSILATQETKFTLSDTYKDAFKLEVICNLFERFLIPWHKAETEYINNNLVAPKGWGASNMDFFLKAYCIDHKCYTIRLLQSVLSTLDHSEVKKSELSIFEKRLSKISDALK